MEKRLFVFQRRIGHRREQQAIGAEPVRIAGELQRMVGAQSADPDDQRRAPGHRLHRRGDRAPSLRPLEIGVEPRAAEEAD